MSQIYSDGSCSDMVLNSRSFDKTNSTLDALEIWDLVKVKIVNLYGEGVFRSWFKFVNFSHYDQGVVFLMTPSKFIKDWIIANYSEFILRSWQEYDQNIIIVEFLINENLNLKSIKNNIIYERETKINEILANSDSKKQSHIGIKRINTKQDQSDFIESNQILEEKSIQDQEKLSGPEDVIGQKIFVETARLNYQRNENLENQILETTQSINHAKIKELSFDSRFTFENFVVGKSNELAYFAARKVAESDKAILGNNPLFLYGGVGLGKTHLMHAIANYKIKKLQESFPDSWFSRAKNKIIYLPSEKFVQEFISALTNNDMRAFKDKFRSTDIFMIDDVQFFSGKDYTQEEFFHTFNSLMDDGKQLVISADRTPGNLDGIEERIRSRLGWGLVADIGSTSYELRMGILKKKVEVMEVSIDDTILDYLANNIETNIRELEGALNKVIAISSLRKQDITIETVQEILFDMVKSSSNTKVMINISQIQKKVCDFFEIGLSELISQNRSRNLARPRQMAMYLSKKLTSSSLTEIARKFGGKDHSTVIHGINKIENLIKSDEEISKQIQEISKFLKMGSKE
jgi:chromosomal replication initiator protein